MDVDQLVSLLDSPKTAVAWLQRMGVQNGSAGHVHLVAMASAGLTLDLLAETCTQLAEQLPLVGDPDLALATLSRFVAASRNPLSFGSLIEQDLQALPVLLQLFSTSPLLGDLLVSDAASYDLLRLTDGEPVSRAALVEEICGEVANLSDSRDVMASLRHFKRRETLRIAYGDIIGRQPIDVVSEQLSFLADAICEAALRAARRALESQRGVPRFRAGQRTQFVLLGLGKLGGLELDYRLQLEVIFLYDGDGHTDGDRPLDNQEFCERIAKKVIQLLAEETELGTAYQIDLQKSPAARQGRHCLSLESTRSHFETRGRTWERQALIKARPVAGDLGLGHAFLDAIEPWVYRRYLSPSDITGIKALKRRLERRTERTGAAILNVEGGVCDVEFIVQFLQLINGGDRREVRTGNTLTSIRQLEQTGCLTADEARSLEDNYNWLRRVEHRLEVMHSPSTHELPESVANLRQLALRCGYREDGDDDVVKAFQDEYQSRTHQHQQIINHLLEETFADETEPDAEMDLVLDPDPQSEQIQCVLGPYGFRDVSDAYHNLFALSVERIPFLSSRRCRHFLASIARRLLQEIAHTPSPDATLANLCRVSDSIGGKGVLWELFSFHPPSLDLYVRLCSSSPYLISILTRYPGMIDELMDSLMLAKLPSWGELQATLDGLCSGVEDIEPTLHSFKNTQHLNVGVRELLGKEDIRGATGTLANVAEACLQRIAHEQYRRQVRKHGQPQIEGTQRPCELIMLAMGKFGGRETNYHSDLDVVVLFEGAGTTSHPATIRRRETTSNQHFFSELAQRIVKFLSDCGPHGRLYDSDPRLRPTGASGPLAVSLDEFRDYYLTESRPLTELRILCQARPVYGSEPLRTRAAKILREILTTAPRTGLDFDLARKERMRIQETAGPRNLKRGPGGIVDIEFITQMLQLRHAAEQPEILQPNTFAALEALQQAGILPAEEAEFLRDSYRFLRQVEARLRLLNTTARHDLPREADELAKLAYLLGFDNATKLEAECARLTRENRQHFDRFVAA